MFFLAPEPVGGRPALLDSAQAGLSDLCFDAGDEQLDAVGELGGVVDDGDVLGDGGEERTTGVGEVVGALR